MARKHGKTTFVSVGGTDLSPFINDSELNQTAETHDVTGYKDAAGTDMSKEYIGGLTDATFTMDGFYDDGATNPSEVLRPLVEAAAAVAIIRRVEGTGSGLPEQTFNAVPTGYTETAPVGGEITWSAEFQVTGQVTETTQA